MNELALAGLTDIAAANTFIGEVYRRSRPLRHPGGRRMLRLHETMIGFEKPFKSCLVPNRMEKDTCALHKDLFGNAKRKTKISFSHRQVGRRRWTLR